MTWKNYRRGYKLRYHPLSCAACSTPWWLEFHHIVPVSVAPELEQVDSNILILCRSHHFSIGHLGNWNKHNPAAAADAKRLKTFMHRDK